MRSCLEVLRDGATSSFRVTRIARSKLYGSKRRIPVDAAGRECRPAALTRDGVHVLPRGGIARLYVDESGNVVDCSDLRAASAPDRRIEGAPPGSPTTPSSPEAADLAEVRLEAHPEDVLGRDVSHAWALDPISLSPQLDATLSAGAIQRVRLPAGFALESADAFMLKGPACFLLLVGEPTEFDLVGRAEIDLSSETEDDDSATESDDDLEFGAL